MQHSMLYICVDVSNDERYFINWNTLNMWCQQGKVQLEHTRYPETTNAVGHNQRGGDKHGKTLSSMIVECTCGYILYKIGHTFVIGCDVRKGECLPHT
jgi:hypothetical protein